MADTTTVNFDLWTSALLNKSAVSGNNASQRAYGIRKLRELILELAARGKLVHQQAKDEPASQLLKRAANDKAAMLRDGTIRDRKFGAITEAEVPFGLPNGWTWARINDVGHDWGQKTPSGAFTYIDVSSIDNERGVIDTPAVLNAADAPSRARRIVKRGTVIYSTVRPYLKNIAVLEEDYSCEPIASTAFAVLHPFQEMPGRFFAHFFRSPTFVEYVESVQAGIAYPAINDAQFYGGLVPVAPLAEQHRVVAKVDELMALCNQLEQEQTRSTEAHQHLVAVLLGTLTRATTSKEYEEAWARIENHFDILFSTDDSIEQLKQIILLLGVTGKLVPQDPDDEAADRSVGRLPAYVRSTKYERRSTARIEGIGALSLGPTIRDVPTGWACVPLIDIARLESGHTPSRSHPEWWGGDVPWVGVVDARLHDGKTIHETRQHTNAAGLANSAARLLPAGTVCVSRTASVGYVVILGRPMATSQDFVNWVPSEVVTSDWLLLVFTAEKHGFDRFSKGAVHQTIYYSEWLAMHTLLPPLEEQKRIIRKVEQLMVLCDALKMRLADALSSQTQIADAVMAQAVA